MNMDLVEAFKTGAGRRIAEYLEDRRQKNLEALKNAKELGDMKQLQGRVLEIDDTLKHSQKR